MKIYQYKDYDDYVETQSFYCKQKINWVYIKEAVVEQIALDKGNAKTILCHGTRNGAEQQYFKNQFPDAYVVGTEISDVAEQFPMTVQHDFTLPREEWINKFDIVYSNSFDHSINPTQTLSTWKDQLVDDGRLYLEYAEKVSVCEPADPLMMTNVEIEELLAAVGLDVVTTFRGCRHRGLIWACTKGVSSL